MTSKWTSRIAWVLGWAMLLGTSLPAGTWAAEEDDQLPIGLPDFPRRIGRELPEIHPGHEIKLGILKLHPSFQSSVEYDDNIRLSKSDDVDDVIFTQRPGIVGEMDVGDHRLEAGYGAELLTFAKEQEENTTNHLAHSILELNFNDLQITASDTLEKSTGRLFNETSVRDHVFLNTVDVLGRYDRPMWAAEVGWRHNTVDHLGNVIDSDYGEDVLSVLGGYKILPKTLWLMELDLGSLNYDHNTGRADQTYWQLWTGLRGELTPKIISTVKLGFQDRQLSDVGGEGPQSDFDGIVADMEVRYNATDNDSVRLGYLRTVRPSTFAGNSWYRQDKIGLSYRKRFLRKWILTPKASWQLNDYPEETTSGGSTDRRDDHFVQAGAELRYEMQEWLSTGLAYNFRDRNSNLDTFDYENNRVKFDVTVAF